MCISGFTTTRVTDDHGNFTLSDHGNFTLADSLVTHNTDNSSTCPTANPRLAALAASVEEWQNMVNDSKSMVQISPTIIRGSREPENDSPLTDTELIQQGLIFYQLLPTTNDDNYH